MTDSKDGIQQDMTTDIQTMSEDITDFMDENPIDDLGDITEINEAIIRLENLRTSYRHVNIQFLSSSDDSHMKRYLEQMDEIKRYIKAAKERRRDIKGANSEATSYVRKKATNFSLKDLEQNLKLLESKVNVDFGQVTDHELVDMSKNVNDLTKSLEKIANQIKDLIKETAGTVQENDVGHIQRRYEKLQKLSHEYNSQLKSELSARDISKHATFKESLLKIKLCNFSGFNSKTDIYTFQNDFEKLHLRSTPRCYLPDLLRNNYLEDPALSIVKGENDIEEIWKRLQSAYGDTKILLNNKLSEFSNIDFVWKLKNQTKIAESLGKTVSIMKDLMALAKKHGIEPKLFHGDGIQRIYKLIGDSRTTRWLQHICDEDPDGEELWNKLIVFLEREIKIHQQKHLINYKEESPRSYLSSTPSNQTSNATSNATSNVTFNSATTSNISESSLKCHFCNSTDHVPTSGPHGTKLIQYFVCKRFVEMSPAERFAVLKEKNLCYQCLFPGAQLSTGKHREGRCQRDFCCQHSGHESYNIRKHVLVCDQHKSSRDNQELLETFKRRCISKRTNIPDFSKTISNYHSTQSFRAQSPSESSEDSGIYQLQHISVNSRTYLMFFDTGCSDFVVRTEAIRQLTSRAELQYKGPIMLGGVGDVSTSSSEGIFSVKLPKFDGSNVTLTGVSLGKITATFPQYPLNRQVKHDIHMAYKNNGGNPLTLPVVSPTVGGDVDFMVGIKYLRYHPKQIFQLPSGLTIYESVFCNPDGSRGIIGGPHQVFNEINKQMTHGIGMNTFVINQLNIYKSGFQINPDVPLLCMEQSAGLNEEFSNPTYINKNLHFEEAESAGSEISYRCSKCRACPVGKRCCKNVVATSHCNVAKMLHIYRE